MVRYMPTVNNTIGKQTRRVIRRTLKQLGGGAADKIIDINPKLLTHCSSLMSAVC